MFRNALLLMFALSLTAFTGTTLAGTEIEDKNWARVGDMEEAVKYAEKAGKPLVIVYTQKESTCPTCIGDSMYVLKSNKLNGMVRVLVYTGENNATLNKARGQVSKKGSIPCVYFLDPQQRVLGFVSANDMKDLKEVAAAATEIVNWEVSAARNIEAADKLAERGQFRRAASMIAKIVQQDLQAQAAVKKMTVDPQRLKKQQEEAKRQQSAQGEQVEAKTPETKFFPNLVEEKAKTYKELGEKRLADARKQIEDGDFNKAMATLRPMVPGPEDFEPSDQASEMLQEVREKIRNAARADAQARSSE